MDVAANANADVDAASAELERMSIPLLSRPPNPNPAASAKSRREEGGNVDVHDSVEASDTCSGRVASKEGSRGGASEEEGAAAGIWKGYPHGRRQAGRGGAPG